MYSLVLMTAMTTAPNGPEFNGFFRDLFTGCNGCNGCCGGYAAPRYSYYGGCSGSAYPAGCSGAYYNGCNGCNGEGLLSRARRWFESWGCCGSGSGYPYGCSGAAYSCHGAAYSCHGGPAVSYTPVFGGGLSCQGGPAWNAPPPVFEPYPAYPTYPAVPGTAPPPTIPYAPPEPAPGFTPQNTGLRPAGYNGSALVSNGGPTARATVVVRLPADARLFADAKPLALTGPERKFVTPELPTGPEFTYRFRIEYDRDGETVSVTKRVPVRAGGSVAVEFTDLTVKAAPERAPEKNTGGGGPVAATPTSNPGPAAGAAAGIVPSVMPAAPVPDAKAAEPAANPPTTPVAPATDRATITVKLPPGAALYVDDRRSPSTEAVRRFSTPPLPTGREFAYLLKAEVVRNGQTETLTQKVPFRAGERVEVDFTAVGR
jgi:uncharacterized protein (TIGR03000 family)